ncbi:MAG: hypothetical protein HOP10_03050 [Chitinophagaceae bacterium]|nr:hypothetical protein [Chitinophagaceae bacterium]
MFTGQPLLPNITSVAIKKPSFISIHGNVQYDFLYRSFSDTPYYQKDFRQHTVKTNFAFLFSNTFPVQVTVLHRNSNSLYFRDITDVSVQFSQRDYFTRLKENLYQQASQLITVNSSVMLKQVEEQYRSKLLQAEQLESWLASPARLQELVAEKERLARYPQIAVQDSILSMLPSGLPDVTVPGKPQLPDEKTILKAIADKLNDRLKVAGDSILKKVDQWEQAKLKAISDSLLKTKTAAFIEKKKQELAKLKKELAQFDKKLKSAKKSIADSLALLKKEIVMLRDPAAIKDFIRKKKLNSKELPKGWQSLLSIRSVGLGRTWVDHSELTAKNISITGINVELNPGNFYFAATTGRINYRFRDFVTAQSDPSPQSLSLFRAGVGKKDGNNFILSWYDGKRNLLNPFNSTTAQTHAERVIGMSAEVRFRINENQYISAEFAKSSFHNTGTVNGSNESLIDKVKNFKDHSNEAYSIKVNNYWPKAGTKFSGYYTKMGEHFQSFNLQPVNSIQESFHLKLQQQLWKKKLTIDAAIRKNDFNNPFISQGISSSTLFKSFQLSLRIPKYPYLTVGFAPSTQLTVSGNQRLTENMYNTLNAVLSYSSNFKNVSMITNAMYLKFYNNSPDTGFIYYNASSFSLMQFFYINKWQLQSGLTITEQQEMKVYTLEGAATWQLRHWLSLTAGLKYNRANGKQTQFGSTAGLNMALNKIGTIQASYDKSLLPGIARDLVPVQTGRVSLYRSF